MGNGSHNVVPRKVMSTLVVQERHLFLSLAETSDVDKELFLNASVSQAGLFADTVEEAEDNRSRADRGHPTHLAPA